MSLHLQVALKQNKLIYFYDVQEHRCRHALELAQCPLLVQIQITSYYTLAQGQYAHVMDFCIEINTRFAQNTSSNMSHSCVLETLRSRMRVIDFVYSGNGIMEFLVRFVERWHNVSKKTWHLANKLLVLSCGSMLCFSEDDHNVEMESLMAP